MKDYQFDTSKYTVFESPVRPYRVAEVEALQAENKHLRSGLQQIATGKNAEGQAVNFFQDIAQDTLNTETGESVEIAIDG